MKIDKTVLIALIVLIGLVVWMIHLSIQRSNDISHAMDRINTVESRKPESIDYSRIQEAIKTEIAKQVVKTEALIPKDGLDGADGRDGQSIQGKDGINGKDGKSTYQLWLDAGNTGTVQDFLQSIKGEKGDTVVPIFCAPSLQFQLKSKMPTDVFWQFVPTCPEKTNG